MALSLGTRLGPYEIISAIGAGGMGEVYRARDTRLDRTVAIKILPQNVASTPEVRQRFEREARAISSLNHPHICVLHDVGHQNGTDFLVMEYLEGESLAKRLEKGPLPTAELLRIAIEIADALEKAHRQGVIHRDLKPGNIILTKSGAKLLDFGLAKAAVAPAVVDLSTSPTASQNIGDSPMPLTARGTIVGTFQYMAPEQLEGKEGDARGDIFSFGAVLYEMATARKAFEGKTTASVIATILKDNPPPITTLVPLAPPTLDQLVRTCLAKDPDDRRQTMHDVLLDLKWIAEGGSQAGLPAPIVAHRKHREGIAWGAAALLLIIAAAFATGYFLRAPQPARAIVARILPPTGQDFAILGNTGGPPVLSPDGQKLAFAALDKNGKQSLWVQRLDSAVPQQLAGTEDAAFPFWSPDSKELGFFSTGRLSRIDASGGPIFTICDVSTPRGGTWNQDGMIVFAPGTTSPLYHVPATGGTPQPVTKLDSVRQEVSHRWPQFLPDQKHFLFLATSRNATDVGIYVSDLNGGTPILLERNDSNGVYAPPGYLLFVRQSTLMAQRFDTSQLKMIGDPAPLAEQAGTDPNVFRGMFTVSDNGLLAYEGGDWYKSGAELLWFDRSGKQLAETGSPSNYVNPAISPDGKQLAVAIGLANFTTGHVWVFDLRRGTETRLTYTPGINREPAWSPDGKSIAFISNREGGFHVYSKAADGTGDVTPILVDNANEFLPAFSRDGRYLVLERGGSQEAPRIGIWALPLFGDRKLISVAQGQFEYVRPSLSPDGKWVAYESSESGRSEVYVVPFPAGKGKWQVSTNGGLWPRWNPAGKELFFISADSKLMAADITEHGTSLDIGSVHELFQAFPAFVVTSFYDIAPDGKKFVIVSRTAESSAPLTLLVNWSALLKKQ